jgi:hypothetical protein
LLTEVSHKVAVGDVAAPSRRGGLDGKAGVGEILAEAAGA